MLAPSFHDGILNLRIENLHVIVFLATTFRVEDVDFLNLWLTLLHIDGQDVFLVEAIAIILILYQLLKGHASMRQLREVEVLFALIIVSFISGVDVREKFWRF